MSERWEKFWEHIEEVWCAYSIRHWIGGFGSLLGFLVIVWVLGIAFEAAGRATWKAFAETPIKITFPPPGVPVFKQQPVTRIGIGGKNGIVLRCEVGDGSETTIIDGSLGK